MNTNLDLIPEDQIKKPVRMPVSEWDKIEIDERRKRETLK